jgi:RNA polymerase sigma-70 factor (ECF subfamily)
MSTDSQAKFIEVYDTYHDPIFRYCLFETSKREVALDLTSDTFMKAWSYLEQGNEVTHMKAFLYRIATNAIIDYRRKKKSTSLDDMMETGFDVGHDEREQLENGFDSKQLMELLDDVGEAYKAVIIMRFIDDMSIKEIADITGESENNISVRIHRATEKLRKIYLEQQEA